MNSGCRINKAIRRQTPDASRTLEAGGWKLAAGFTLAEILVTLAVVLVLISASLRLGQYVRQRGNIQLTQSMLAVIDTALQQYHTDHGAFPQEVFNTADFVAAVGANSVSLLSGALQADDWPSAALFYFLDSAANSRSIIDALTSTLITNKDNTGTAIVIRITKSGIDTDKDFIRVIDPWKMSLWYEYDPAADSFPRVISAGPDKVFGTPDDIENK